MLRTRFCEVISHLGRQQEDARVAFRDLKAKVARLRAALGATQSMAEAGRTLVLEAADEYLEGYEKSLLHVRTLFLGLDLQPFKPYMRSRVTILLTRSKGRRKLPRWVELDKVLLMMLTP